ncbi:hypothetical protein KGQ71_00300 [Patescibacteria group bacterium]|nr:hypothetical protein [Patescibacteria group bacterium]
MKKKAPNPDDVNKRLADSVYDETAQEAENDQYENVEKFVNAWREGTTEQLTLKSKLDFIYTIAEQGERSGLRELLANKRGFESFQEAMEEFGVNERGTGMVYGSRVRGAKETGLSRFWRNRVRDIKRGGIGAAVGVTALVGLGAAGIIAAPALLPSVLAGGAGVLASTVARGAVEYGMEERRMFHGKGGKFEGSVAYEAAAEMVKFCKEAQARAKEAYKLITEQGSKWTENERQQLLLHTLNIIIDGVNDPKSMVNSDRFRKYLKQSAVVKAGAGLVAGISAASATAHFLAPKFVEGAARYVNEHGARMIGDRLATPYEMHQHLGHIVRMVNGEPHRVIDFTKDFAEARAGLQTHDFHVFIQDPSTLHDPTLASHYNEFIKFLNGHVQYAIDPHTNKVIGSIPFNAGDPSMLAHITHGGSGNGFELTPEVMKKAQELGVTLYHVANHTSNPSVIMAGSAVLDGFAMLTGATVATTGEVGHVILGTLENYRQTLSRRDITDEAERMIRSANTDPVNPPKKPEEPKEEPKVVTTPTETPEQKTKREVGEFETKYLNDPNLKPQRDLLAEATDAWVPAAKDGIVIGASLEAGFGAGTPPPDFSVLTTKVQKLIEDTKAANSGKDISLVISMDAAALAALAKLSGTGTKPEEVTADLKAALTVPAFDSSKDRLAIVRSGAYGVDAVTDRMWLSHIRQRTEVGNEAGKPTGYKLEYKEEEITK